MLVEVKDNLVVAFRAANDALRLSLSSAKAWFRRAGAFEAMRDYRNALLDLEEVRAASEIILKRLKASLNRLKPRLNHPKSRLKRGVPATGAAAGAWG